MTTLAIEDYDHLTVGELTHRARTLTREQLEDVVAHERDHGARTHVLAVLLERLAQLDAGGSPSGGDPAGAVPRVGAVAGTGPVSGDTGRRGPNPPSHGDPTNPVQETP